MATKEINTETKFGYVMKHLHKIKPNFISIFSLNTDLFEMLDQTPRSVLKNEFFNDFEACFSSLSYVLLTSVHIIFR